MFSNDHSIEPTFHSFYIVFDSSSFLELQVNQYKLLLFLLIIYLSGICLGVILIYIKYPSSSWFETYFVDCLLVCIIFIVSAFIDTETFPWV